MSMEKTLTVRVTKELHTALKVKAAQSQVSLSQVVRWLLQGWLDNMIVVGKAAGPLGNSREKEIAKGDTND